ncbi:MAG: hypothetical protein ACQEXC_05955 [Pseudomonadota bacterium]|uniref:hypothetical protein n=1 Tax=Halomonas TaxID=2745 RepID=UPI001478FFFC|nr:MULTISPECIES: hypothetical protein [Halomonas]MCE0733146.1 hypothetical protein [Halomonas sp. G15]
MSLFPIAGDRRRRGATRRRVPAARGARFDRWLDRLVDAAVIIALLVGGIALVLTLLR